MKYYLLILTCGFILYKYSESSPLKINQHETINLVCTSISGLLLSETGNIDALDTVVFDLSKAMVSGSFVEFPVSILSNDSVYSLDFWFEFNHANLSYDSIYDLTNYLQSLSYYNLSDSIVRFTSNSFQKYSEDTSLVSIRFQMLSVPLNISDFSNINVLLNGAPCSYKIVNSIIDGILSNDKDPETIFVYPNPTEQKFYIQANENSKIELWDINGNQIFLEKSFLSDRLLEINPRNIPIGIYFLKVSIKNKISIKKITIIH